VRDFLSTVLFRVGETEVTVSSLLLSLAILVGSFVLSRFARNFVANRLLGRTRLAVGSRYAIGRVLGYVILTLGILVALQPLGVNATTLAVFGGALGIGLGPLTSGRARNSTVKSLTRLRGREENLSVTAAAHRKQA
jgi:small-conductance mechanosensitive channel